MSSFPLTHIQNDRVGIYIFLIIIFFKQNSFAPVSSNVRNISPILLLPFLIDFIASMTVIAHSEPLKNSSVTFNPFCDITKCVVSWHS